MLEIYKDKNVYKKADAVEYSRIYYKYGTLAQRYAQTLWSF